MKKLACTTAEINPLTEQVYRIRLQPKVGNIFGFKGGQYLYLCMPDGKKIPLSIASPPEQTQFIELHIKLVPGHELPVQMLRLFESAKSIKVEGPFGQCFLKNSPNDVVIIAGGTGFSPMKSLLESALLQPATRKFSLYLGAQSSKDLYQLPLVESWETDNSQFKFVPVIDKAEKEWKGATGFPHQIALAELGDKIKQCDFYLGGSMAMVMNVYQDLLDAGVSKQNIFSDILDIKREMGELV